MCSFYKIKQSLDNAIVISYNRYISICKISALKSGSKTVFCDFGGEFIIKCK